MTAHATTAPSVSIPCAATDTLNELGIQERAYQKRREHLLIKPLRATGTSSALKTHRVGHDRNDETLVCIYIGQSFDTYTERFEKFFDMYTKMTSMKEKAL